ncbi:MAG: hypothetical protein HY860_02175 [Chlamydiales bacterium]|nr:hypothetical protein [Chlamydiales bacterium]
MVKKRAAKEEASVVAEGKASVVAGAGAEASVVAGAGAARSTNLGKRAKGERGVDLGDGDGVVGDGDDDTLSAKNIVATVLLGTRFTSTVACVFILIITSCFRALLPTVTTRSLFSKSAGKVIIVASRVSSGVVTTDTV